MKRQGLEKLKQNLPKYPGIMGRDKFFNAAVLIPLIPQGEEYSFLFEKRAKNIRQGGEISFPGGKFEPEQDKSCVNAALRETEEELGIQRDQIQVVGRLDTFISPRGIIIESFIGVLDIEIDHDLRPDKDEVEDILLIPVSWFEKNPPKQYKVQVEMKPYYFNKKGERISTLPIEELGLPPRYHNPWPSLDYEVFVFEHPQAIIWGITARLIVDIISKLNTL